MRIRPDRASIGTRSVLGGALLILAAHANAGGLGFEVIDKDGHPVSQVAVYAIPKDSGTMTDALEPDRDAVMDQQAGAFVPHILVVETGTKIRFPNSDSVSHHVYSFSPAKAFELPLYKHGAVHEPLTFETPGVVTLGCNIHDDMVGYILIVETPYFAMTDIDGLASFDNLPSGQYSVKVWTPRMRPADLPTSIDATVGGDKGRRTVQFRAKLHPAHDSRETSLKWANY